MLSLRNILKEKGLDCSKKIKLVRHQDKRYDVEELCRRGQIEIYQSYQATPIFNCDYIVAFIGFGGTHARMIGVYKVKGQKAAKDVSLPADFIYPDFVTHTGYYYELEEVPGFEDLKKRVVIEWGKGTLAWHQWLKHKDKEVLEILPGGYVKEFSDYLDFILTYDELVDICKKPIANREWHKRLSTVAGVYLIVDTSTGLQYVGSAYGEKGILGRWLQYARTGHGGNSKLKQLLSPGKSRAENFTFTILRTLPKTLTKNEVIEKESFYKEKLGTRAFGLNLN